MTTPDPHLHRLFRAAARATRDLPAEAPFAVELRLLACWRSAVLGDDTPVLLALFRWAFVGACLMMLLSVAANYPSLRAAGPNVLSLADSAIKSSLLP